MVSHPGPSHAMSVVSVVDPNGSNDLKIKCSDFLDRNVFSTPGTLSNWAWKPSEKTSLDNFNLGQAHFAYAVASVSSVYQSLPSLWAPESAHSKSSYLCSCEIPIRTKPTANPIRTNTLKLNEIDATDITKINEGQANLRFLRRCCVIGLH